MERKRTIVIGGGLGGLSAAISLASDGYEVDLFEKNDKIGGKLNLLEQDGFRFDLGPSIVIMPEVWRAVFAKAGERLEDHVKMVPVEPQWRSIFTDGVITDLHGDREAMNRELAKLGASQEEYGRFVDYSRGIYEAIDRSYFAGADSLGDMVRDLGIMDILRKLDPIRTVRSGVEAHVSEPHLRDVLSFFIKYVGSSPWSAPAVLNLMLYAQLAGGLWYVRGGLYELARGLGRVLDKLGVRVHLGAEVTEITRSGQRVTGVRLQSGDTIAADAVLCNMEIVPAYRRLLGLEEAKVAKLERRYEPSASGLVIHLGVSRDFPLLAHHNFFFSADPRGHLTTIHRDKRLPDDPTLYVVCPTRTDASLAPPGQHVIKILPHVPYLTDSPPKLEEYAALEERVYDKLERMGLAGLREAVVTRDVLTPYDLERLYYSNRGSIYGVVSDRWKNLGFKASRKSSQFDGLYFVGGSVNPGGGMPMVLLSGQLAGRQVARHLEQSREREPAVGRMALDVPPEAA